MTRPSTETRQSALSLARIEEAARVIDPVFRDSPQYTCDALSAELGVRLLCKVECVNPIRSFKGRGADYFLHSRAATSDTLVAASAGNFGQGLAYSARTRGTKVLIFAATTANPLKIERMRALGAEVRLAGGDFDAAKQAAREFAKAPGYLFVEDGSEPAIAEGAGTIGRELCAWPEPIHTLLVPVGNGALIAGVGRWIKAHSPTTRVVGVVAANAPSMRLSWQQGRSISTETADTVADGIAVREPVALALAEMLLVVDNVVAVGEEQLVDAVRLAHRHLGLVLEPSGAAGLAAAREPGSELRGKLVATILCGGNVMPDVFAKWVGE